MSKVVLITGGSRGIGAATALLAAAEGYAVGVNYRKDEQSAAKIVDLIRQNGGQAIAIRADISQEKEVETLFDQVCTHLGPLDALVNNAGILDTRMPLVDMPAERIRQIFEVNVVGTLLCSREAVRRMSVGRNGQGGAIVNVSSAAARLGSPFEYVDYAASKGAVDTFTIGLAKEVAKEGIRVNAVRPGFIDTDIHEAGRLDQVLGFVPLGRAGQAEEVAQAILWLLSDKASFTSGAIIDVAGGR